MEDVANVDDNESIRLAVAEVSDKTFEKLQVTQEQKANESIFQAVTGATENTFAKLEDMEQQAANESIRQNGLGAPEKASEKLQEMERQAANERTSRDDTDTAATSKGKKAKTRPAEVQVYGYMKKKLLNHMEEYGCSAKSVDLLINASKFNKDSIIDYMNERMEMAQLHVHEECNSLSFINIEKWLKYFKTINLPESCIYEPALVINSIANNEEMPDADALDGIDLKSVYKFLGNGLLGLPQSELNEKSAAFLAKEFEILVGAANTDFGDKETLRLNKKLLGLKELPCMKKTETASVDPFGFTDNQQMQTE